VVTIRRELYCRLVGDSGDISAVYPIFFGLLMSKTVPRYLAGLALNMYAVDVCVDAASFQNQWRMLYSVTPSGIIFHGIFIDSHTS